jgi:signal transduction histidine kinase
LLAGVEELVASSQRALLLNLLLIPTSLGLGLVAMSGIRKAERLASEREAADARRELERRLWHAERLASVGRLAAGIAHEINNPLAGTTSWLALLEEDVAGGDAANARVSMGKVRHGLDRIGDVVRRTLTFADPGQASASSVDLAAVVAETAAFVGDLEKECGVDVTAAGPILVLGDRAALGQLVLNLLLNAVTIQGPGGRVAVAVTSTREEAVVTVDDTGPGIAPEVLGRLFEPFVSGRGSTGLGLAVCHGIVVAHGGTITGENRPRGGARFVVRLPLEAPLEGQPS